MVHDTTQQFPHGFTLMIDNYDSFTHNIYQYLEQSGAHVKVVRNDEISLDDLDAYLQAGQLKNIVISPGPGHPRHESGISRQAILWAFGKVPLLGICMGLECLVDVLGGEIEYAGEIVHGKTSLVTHDGRGLFRSLPQNLKSVRYHSLATNVLNLPAELQVTSTTTQSGVVMGVRHRVYTVEAVQYHPESVLSEGGMELVKNFLDMHGGKWSDCPEFGIGSDIDGVDTPKLVKQVDQQTHGEDVKVEPTPPAAAAVASSPSSPSSPLSSSTATLTPAPAPLPTILTQIHAQRLLDVDSASSHLSTTPAQLKTHLSLELAPPLIPLVPRLLQSAPLPAILAEVKRASPSKGEIAPDTNAPSQALLYAHAGASVISVLTEPTWFKGSLVDMLAVRTALGELPNRPAVLRKDFVLSTYQIDEARFYGADTVLLIVAMLTPQLLAELYAHSVALGMEPLVEVNNAAELERALELGAKVLGVNNRNLHNFEVDMSTTSRMNDVLKRTSRQDKPIMIALSGIAGRQDVLGYLDEGVQGLLVGESLMRAKDPKLFIQQLLDLPTDVHPSSSSSSSAPASLLPNGSSSSSSSSSSSPTPSPSAPLVKICGIRSTADAQIAISAGADMLGMIFVENSKRQVSVQTAYQIAQLVRFARYANPPAASSSSTPSSPLKPKGWFTHHADALSASRKPVLVGVFQDQPLAHILSVVSEVGLDLVQLHGHEPAEWASFIPVPVIRVHHVQTSSSSSSSSLPSPSPSSSSPSKPIISPADVTRTGLNRHILLDAGLSGGGTGETFDWSVARDLVESARETGGSALPIILAGGLTEENVEQAVKAVRPWCVDVSSGVELKEAGAVGKDWARCKAFVDRAKRA